MRDGTEKTVLRTLPFYLSTLGLQGQNNPAAPESPREAVRPGAAGGAFAGCGICAADADASETWKCGDAASGEQGDQSESGRPEEPPQIGK